MGGRFESIIGKLLITTLPDLVRPNDRVLVYFAGHGRNRSKPGAGRPKPFLIPEEAAHGEWDEYIDLDALAEHISEYNAKHVLCILDACCAGLLGVRADDRPRRYEQSLLQRKARQCITSGTAEERADDGGYQGHSLFTGYLLQALDQIDKSRARCPSGARARLLLSRTGNPSADRGRSRGSAGGIGPALHRARSPARTGQRATAAIPSGECPMTGGSAARSQRRNRW